MIRYKILILGGTGMLGHVLLRCLSMRAGFDVYATLRNTSEVSKYFPPELAGMFWKENVIANEFDTVASALDSIRPDVVVNCIGIIKQLPIANDPLTAITVNALFPHLLALKCRDVEARMIHISTDCVFDGRKGMYTEEDVPAPDDLYGRTKLLGEVDYPHCVTLRTSMVGHELKSSYGLIEWFLSQTGKVKGYRKVIYSGFPTIELARVIRDHVIPDIRLTGLYHVSSEPVSKFDLLRMVEEKYGKKTIIEPYDDLMLDRSMRSDRFCETTGYMPPSWPELIDAMHDDYEAHRGQYGR